MFEQELYNQETPAAPTQEGDLFHKYEIKPWEFSPRIYKIIGVAALANILFFAGIAQTNVMTMRGCDSPFVGRVCQVLDMAYVGTVLFGTEREYVDMAYEKTDLGDAEITFISMDRNEPLFEYPPGYFQPEPEQTVIDPLTGFSTSGTEFAPGIPSNPTFRNNPPAQRLPKYNSRAVTGEPEGWDNDPEVNPTDPTKNGSKNPGAEVDPKVTAGNANSDPKVEPTKPVDAVTINREVMRDFGKDIAAKIESKEVDISKNFKVTAVAVLTPDGKLDSSIDKKTKLQKSRILTAEGDQQMIDIASAAIAAVGDSGWLGYLRNEGIEKLNFTFSQTDDDLVVVISSEQLTPERAKLVTTQLQNKINGALLGAGIGEGIGLIKLGDDEKALLKAASASSIGKIVQFNFTLPKPVAQEMILRNVNKARESETGKKENGRVDEINTNRNSLSR